MHAPNILEQNAQIDQIYTRNATRKGSQEAKSMNVTNKTEWLRNAYGYADASARKDGILVQDLGWISYCYTTHGREVAVEEAKNLGYFIARTASEMLKFATTDKKVAMITGKDVQLVDPPTH
jgi:hypothetical protein